MIHIVTRLGRFLATAFLVIPLLCACAASADTPPTQIVYRFDDHRYLTLTGHRCEGAISYVDTKLGIRTQYIEQYGRVFLPPISHADDDGDYIFIPYSDASGIAVSKDHGKSFKSARWVGTRPYVEEIKKVVIVNRQAFIELKDGRLFMTSKPFGKGWGMMVIDPVNHLPTTVFSERPEFQDLPTKIPEVKDYRGWTQMRCDPDL